MKYLKSNFSDISRIRIKDIPLYVIEPKEKSFGVKNLIFYHGWSSSSLKQIFRGNIFSAFGYRVFLPDAIYHGERSPIDYEDSNIGSQYFIYCINKNIRESKDIISYIKNKYPYEDIGVAGHSMGAISSAGVFTLDEDLKAAMIFNGILDYEYFVDRAKEKVDFSKLNEKFKQAPAYLLEVNPMNNLDKLIDRPLLLFNGDEDNIIDPDIQEDCSKKLYKLYKNKELLSFKRFELTTHQLTSQMLEEAIIFLKDRVNF